MTSELSMRMRATVNESRLPITSHYLQGARMPGKLHTARKAFGAIAERDEHGKVVQWMEPVSDEQYLA